ncbi:MAG: RidA family protein [Candidatus Hydrogenedentales bacterium]|jgi:2-iminobutanoate/2-iminopropanoate deaminase
MEKRCIHSKNGPPAQGPYSHAVAAGRLLFVSGQIATARDGSGIQKGTLEDETRLALTNLKTVLEDAGSGLQHVVKITAYLDNMRNFSEFNEIYKEYFPMNPPARTCIEVGKLPLDALVEVDAIAIIPD